MNRVSCVAGSLLAVVGSLSAQSLDVPITLQETAGVKRVAEPVTFGVPLPEGLLQGTDRLQLYGPGGQPVPAAFRVASRWSQDAGVQNSSIRWVQADFFADVEARG